MDQSLSEINPVYIHGKPFEFSTIIPYLPVLHPVNAAICYEMPYLLKLTCVKPYPVFTALINNYTGYSCEVFSVHHLPAPDAGYICHTAVNRTAAIFLFKTYPAIKWNNMLAVPIFESLKVFGYVFLKLFLAVFNCPVPDLIFLFAVEPNTPFTCIFPCLVLY